MKQLDSIRMIAAVMVICSHWTGVQTFWFNGGVGVQLFFVISGFLITGILLDARDKAVQQGVDPRRVVQRFYIRRCLRIFPLFYATLALTYLAGIDAVRDSIQWHLSYLSNVFFALRGDWFGPVSHFWSLAVEEQFYLIWPFVILFAPRHLILPVIICCMVIAPVFRVLARTALDANEVAITVLPFSSFDTLGIGALFAYLHYSTGHTNTDPPYNGRRGVKLKPSSLAAYLGIVGVCVWLLCQRYNADSSDGVFVYNLSRIAMVLSLLGVVYGAANGFRGVIGFVLELRPLIYLGKISYGLYMFHFFVPKLTSQAFGAFGFSAKEMLGSHGLFFLNFAVLVTLSALSWHFFEKTITDFKKYYPYVPASR